MSKIWKSGPDVWKTWGMPVPDGVILSRWQHPEISTAFAVKRKQLISFISKFDIQTFYNFHRVEVLIKADDLTSVAVEISMSKLWRIYIICFHDFSSFYLAMKAYYFYINVRLVEFQIK